MRARRSMFFGVSYLVLWDNVQNKPDQSTLGRDERKREKMGFITHSGDRSLSLQGKKKKQKKNTLSTVSHRNTNHHTNKKQRAHAQHNATSQNGKTIKQLSEEQAQRIGSRIVLRSAVVVGMRFCCFIKAGFEAEVVSG